MVIAQVISNLSIGGADRLFVNLCNALQGDRVVVVLLGDADIQPSLEAGLRDDIEVRRLRMRKRAWYRDVKALAGLLEETGCDVVHTHMFWPNLYGALAARRAGIPLVTSEHGRNEWKNGWHRWLEVKVISRVARLRLCVSQDILDRRHEVPPPLDADRQLHVRLDERELIDILQRPPPLEHRGRGAAEHDDRALIRHDRAGREHMLRSDRVRQSPAAEIDLSAGLVVDLQKLVIYRVADTITVGIATDIRRRIGVDLVIQQIRNKNDRARTQCAGRRRLFAKRVVQVFRGFVRAGHAVAARLDLLAFVGAGPRIGIARDMRRGRIDHGLVRDGCVGAAGGACLLHAAPGGRQRDLPLDRILLAQGAAGGSGRR